MYVQDVTRTSNVTNPTKAAALPANRCASQHSVCGSAAALVGLDSVCDRISFGGSYRHFKCKAEEIQVAPHGGDVSTANGGEGSISPKDSETGARNAPDRSSEKSSLPGILWEVCSVQSCGKILGAKEGLPEDDGKLSHALCEQHAREYSGWKISQDDYDPQHDEPSPLWALVVLLVPWCLLAGCAAQAVALV